MEKGSSPPIPVIDILETEEQEAMEAIRGLRDKKWWFQLRNVILQLTDPGSLWKCRNKKKQVSMNYKKDHACNS